MYHYNYYINEGVVICFFITIQFKIKRFFLNVHFLSYNREMLYTPKHAPYQSFTSIHIHNPPIQ